MISKCGRIPIPKLVFIVRSVRLMIGMHLLPRSARIANTCSLSLS
jgi:hypothetical protein